MGKLLKKINLLEFLTFLVFAFLIYVIYFSLSQDFFYGDVFWEGIPIGWEYFLKPVHGRYFAEILERIIGFVNYFGIHPMDFTNTGLAWIRAFITVFLCFAVSFSMYIDRKKDLFLPLFLIVIFGLTIKYECICDHIADFFGYTTQLIFLFWGFNIVFRYFMRKTLPETKKEIFEIIVFAFFTGMDSEFVNISFLFSMLFLFSYHIISVIKNNKEKIFQKIIYPVKVLIVPIIMFFFTFFAAYLNPKFWDNFHSEKHMVMSFDYFFNTFLYCKDFFQDYYKFVILGNKEFYITIFVILILSLLFIKREKEKISRFILITLCMLFGVLMFFAILFICGKNDLGLSWLNHWGLMTSLKFSLIFITSIAFGFFISLIKISSIKAVIQIIIIALLFCYIPNPKFIYEKYKYYNEVNKNIRTDIYKLDKIAVFYFSKNQDAYLPKDYLYMFMEKVFHIFGERLKREHDDVIYFYRHYIELTYNNNKFIENKVIPMNSKEAFEKFEKEGGIIAEEELKNLNFTSLRYGK